MAIPAPDRPHRPGTWAPFHSAARPHKGRVIALWCFPRGGFRDLRKGQHSCLFLPPLPTHLRHRFKMQSPGSGQEALAPALGTNSTDGHLTHDPGLSWEKRGWGTEPLKRDSPPGSEIILVPQRMNQARHGQRLHRFVLY